MGIFCLAYTFPFFPLTPLTGDLRYSLCLTDCSMSYVPIQLKGQQYYEALGCPEVNTVCLLVTGLWQLQSKEEPCQACRAGCKHSPYQGNEGQCALREDMASIHTGTHTHTETKHTALWQLTQGLSHRKTALQDHSACSVRTDALWHHGV